MRERNANDEVASSCGEFRDVFDEGDDFADRKENLRGSGSQYQDERNRILSCTS